MLIDNRRVTHAFRINDESSGRGMSCTSCRGPFFLAEVIGEILNEQRYLIVFDSGALLRHLFDNHLPPLRLEAFILRDIHAVTRHCFALSRPALPQVSVSPRRVTRLP